MARNVTLLDLVNAVSRYSRSDAEVIATCLPSRLPRRGRDRARAPPSAPRSRADPPRQDAVAHFAVFCNLGKRLELKRHGAGLFAMRQPPHRSPWRIALMRAIRIRLCHGSHRNLIPARRRPRADSAWCEPPCHVPRPSGPPCRRHLAGCAYSCPWCLPRAVLPGTDPCPYRRKSARPAQGLASWHPSTSISAANLAEKPTTLLRRATSRLQATVSSPSGRP